MAIEALFEQADGYGDPVAAIDTGREDVELEEVQPAMSLTRQDTVQTEATEEWGGLSGTSHSLSRSEINPPSAGPARESGPTAGPTRILYPFELLQTRENQSLPTPVITAPPLIASNAPNPPTAASEASRDDNDDGEGDEDREGDDDGEGQGDPADEEDRDVDMVEDDESLGAGSESDSAAPDREERYLTTRLVSSFLWRLDSADAGLRRQTRLEGNITSLTGIGLDLLQSYTRLHNSFDRGQNGRRATRRSLSPLSNPSESGRLLQHRRYVGPKRHKAPPLNSMRVRPGSLHVCAELILDIDFIERHATLFR